MNFRDAIRKMHEDSGVSFSAASLSMGRAPQYISVLLQNSGNPRLDTCASVANAFGFRLIVRGGEAFYSIRGDVEDAKAKNEIPATDAIRRITEACPQTNYAISKALGKSPAYISSTISRGTMPTLDTFVVIAEACGDEVVLKGHSQIYYLSKRAMFSATNRGVSSSQEGGLTSSPRNTRGAKESVLMVDQQQMSFDLKNNVGTPIASVHADESESLTEAPDAEDSPNGTGEAEYQTPGGPRHFGEPATPAEVRQTESLEERKLDDYKKRLLDLSMRNNLLNYRDKKTGTLHVVAPDMVAVYRRIVLNEKPMTFRESSSEDDVQPSGGGESSITTERTRADLIRSLRRLDTVARSSIDEQGINILYLAFGMLHWIDESLKEHLAPLVMAPVRLTRPSARSSFILQADDDDPVVNPTLVYYLEQTYGMALPPFEKEDQLQKFLVAVSTLVQARDGWSVESDVVLSTFQFQKLSMYHDLEARSGEILAHPIVKAIMGDGSALGEMSEAGNPDSFKPTDTYQVVDADASQQAAILAAHAGASFVLQGPPGTGKSQTITNIIADCLGCGKKVLFVSEKKAALDVVHRRLTQAKLDDFCLVLHSNKAGKKEVLSQLNHTLSLYGTQPRMSAAASTRLNTMVSLRDELNGYADAIYQPIEPLGRSPYEIIGAVARYEKDGVPWISCHIDCIRFLTPQMVSQMADAMRAYARELGRMGEGPDSNPWNSFGIPELEYGESGEVIRTFSQVAKGARELNDIWSRMTTELEVDVPPTYDALEASVNLLDRLSKMPVVPMGVSGMPVSDSRDLINEWALMHKEVVSAVDLVFGDLYELKNLDPMLDLGAEPIRLYGTGYATRLADELENKLQQIPHYAAWQRMSEQDLDLIVSRLKDSVSSYERHKGTILADYHPEILDIDFKAMESRFKTEYQSFFKRLFGQHNEDLRTLSGVRRTSSRVDDEEALRILSLLHDLSNEERSLDERHEIYESQLGECYRGMQTDFDQIARRREALRKARVCIEHLRRHEITAKKSEAISARASDAFGYLYVPNDRGWTVEAEKVVDAFDDLLTSCESMPSGVRLGGAVALLAESWFTANATALADELRATLKRRRSVFRKAIERSAGVDLGRRNLDQLAGAIDAATSAGTVSLERSVSYTHAKKACVDLGLEGLVDALSRDSHYQEQAYLDNYDLILRHTVYRLWLGSVALAARPALREFSVREHERRVTRFSDLDSEQLDIDQARVLTELFPRIPSPNVRARSKDEISILLRELNKKARIRPIRKLFADIPHAVLALKPCLMMSPLSVSTYLESASFQFDTVIFDEASQVRTEDALGVISRGKQVIIAGDSKQLPPTNFFAATVAEDDDDGEEEYYEQAGSFDSVLDEAALLSSISLKWHYRSRDESLITFSNEQIYDSDLFTFPSNRTSGRDSGVEYVYVSNGVYEGSRKGNTIEAARVADLVMAHFATYGTERSLGVIALGENQARVIENELLERRIANPDAERFFDAGAEEAFFIKNLENVQGDERDTIILSVGYAKGPNGKLSHNFGPINMEGGERRLNVAVTRARINLKLVTSLDPSEIDVDRVSNVGPRMLRDYLSYAKVGPTDGGSTHTREYGYVDDDAFAKVVRDTIAENGYEVEEHVGKSGCKVDLAVRHPEHRDCYCIGIVCDGDSYHAATTARDRDRLRSQVLRGMGWNLHHVWSRAWLQDPERQKELLLEAIKTAVESFEPPVELEQHETLDAQQPVKQGAQLDEPHSQQLAIPIEESQPAKQASLSDASDKGGSAETEPEEKLADSEYLEVERHVEEHRYGFQNYPTYMPPRRGSISDLELLKQLVYAQAPFSVDYFLQKYRELCYGSGHRLSDVIRRTGMGYLQTKLKDIVILRKEHGTEYVFRKDQRVVIPRVVGNRSIGDISTTELREGVLAVLRGYMGELDRAGLVEETAAAFEFGRRGKTIDQRIGEAIDDLRLFGQVRVVDGLYVPAGRR